MFKFISGLLIGCGIGAFAYKYYVDHKYDTEYVDEKAAQNENKEESNKKEEKAAQNEKIKETKERIKRYKEELNKEEHPVDSDEDEDEEMDAETSKLYNEGLKMTENYNKNKDKKPEIISIDKLGDLPPSVGEVELVYYTENCVLAEAETLEPIDNIEFFIGDALDKYGFADENNSEMYIYVMNYHLNTVYQIIKIRGKFNVNGGKE